MKKIFFYFILSLFLFPIFTHAATSTLFRATVTDVEEYFLRIETKDGERISIEKKEDTYAQLAIDSGDRVLVEKVIMDDGTEQYIVVDIVRGPWIYFLIVLFVLVVFFISRRHGLKALLSLLITFAVVIFVIIPLILRGWNPVWTAVLFGSLVMIATMYGLHGVNKKSHCAVVSIILSLGIAGILSWIFVSLTSLSGFADEEASYLLSLGFTNIDMRGVLLAAILIGSLGILDDLIISQVSVVKEITDANKNLFRLDVFRRAMRVGQDHTSAIINTLFFAYAGAAFPLLILITLQEPPFNTFNNIINNEIIATELVRTLVGSIALLLSAPIATWIAASVFVKK